MISFFVPFLQLAVLLVGGQWLLNEKMERHEFWRQLIIINIIGQGLYPQIKFFAIFFVVAYLSIYRLLKTNQLFLSVIASSLPLITMVIGDYLSQLMIGIGRESLPPFLSWEQSVLLETLMMGGFTLTCCYFFKNLFQKIVYFPMLEKHYRLSVLVQVSLFILLLYANIYAGEKQGFSSQHIRLTSLLFVAYGGLLF